MTETLDMPSRQAMRLGWAFVCALALHIVIIAAAANGLQVEEPEEGGLLALDMPPLAVENASSATDNSELAQDATSAPPPSDADSALPPDEPPEAEAKPDTSEPPPEPMIEKTEAPEPAPQPVEETVPEAPKAPEPEVVLPKAVEQPKAVQAPQEKKPDQKKEPERKLETEKGKAKSAPKSDSKAASSAAASGGQFSASAISRPQPPYPSSARASRIEGSVVVHYTVSPSGSVTGVSIVSASPPGVFNSVTLSAVRSWRFRPSATGGSGTTTVRFKLR